MKTYKKISCVVSVCLLSLTLSGLTVAAVKSDKAQSTAKSMMEEKNMFSFSASADKATIKPIDNKTDQITFHNVQSITFISHHPEVTAGSMRMEKFVKEIWSDDAKVNIAISGIGAWGAANAIYAFEASNPRYDVATKDFTLDIVGFGNKTKSGFKAQQETELKNVSFWINGLTMGKQKAETIALILGDRSGLPNVKNLALTDMLLIKEGNQVFVENANAMKPIGTADELKAHGNVEFPPTNPAVVELKTAGAAPGLVEYIESKEAEKSTAPVVDSWWDNL